MSTPVDCVFGLHGLPAQSRGLVDQFLGALEARGARVAIAANGRTVKRFDDELDQALLASTSRGQAPSPHATAIELLRSLRHTQTERPLAVLFADGSSLGELLPKLQALGEAGACVFVLGVASGEDSVFGESTPFEGDRWRWKSGVADSLLQQLISQELG
ncbi:MAG: hypothetical protein HY791_03785 [Deltaproteobacteria bacterium]|nr:hypothetical protein [Deltaproteobacteria bacterium]